MESQTDGSAGRMVSKLNNGETAAVKIETLPCHNPVVTVEVQVLKELWNCEKARKAV